MTVDFQVKPDFKKLRSLAKDSPVLLKLIDDYEHLWTTLKVKKDIMQLLGDLDWLR